MFWIIPMLYHQRNELLARLQSSLHVAFGFHRAAEEDCDELLPRAVKIHALGFLGFHN